VLVMASGFVIYYSIWSLFATICNETSTSPGAGRDPIGSPTSWPSWPVDFGGLDGRSPSAVAGDDHPESSRVRAPLYLLTTT